MVIFLLVLGVPLGIFAAVYAWAKKNDDPTARKSRDAERYSYYQARHRQMRSVWQRAGHVYEGKEHGPVGIAVVLTGIILILLLGFCQMVEGESATCVPFLLIAWLWGASVCRN